MTGVSGWLNSLVGLVTAVSNSILPQISDLTAVHGGESLTVDTSNLHLQNLRRVTKISIGYRPKG